MRYIKNDITIVVMGVAVIHCVYISIVGHGFKLAPVVGKILSEMTLGLPPSYDLQPFKLDRFKKA